MAAQISVLPLPIPAARRGAEGAKSVSSATALETVSVEDLVKGVHLFQEKLANTRRTACATRRSTSAGNATSSAVAEESKLLGVAAHSPPSHHQSAAKRPWGYSPQRKTSPYREELPCRTNLTPPTAQKRLPPRTPRPAVDQESKADVAPTATPRQHSKPATVQHSHPWGMRTPSPRPTAKSHDNLTAKVGTPPAVVAVKCQGSTRAPEVALHERVATMELSLIAANARIAELETTLAVTRKCKDESEAALASFRRDVDDKFLLLAAQVQLALQQSTAARLCAPRMAVEPLLTEQHTSSTTDFSPAPQRRLDLSSDSVRSNKLPPSPPMVLQLRN